MRKFYPGNWIQTNDSFTSTNAARKKCANRKLSVSDRDDLVLDFNGNEFEIIPLDDRFSLVFDFTLGGFLQVNQNCVPFVENDESVGEDVSDIDEEKLLWIVE